MKSYLLSIRWHRLATIAMLGLCYINCQAKKSIAEQLDFAIYEDFAKSQSSAQLYNCITQDDIDNMPDSVLLKYHYLGGLLNGDIQNFPKAIEHFSKAKRLCETKLGIHTIIYMEIMCGLGDEYSAMGENAKALEIFQEAIVKSMAIRDYARIPFCNLLIGLAECCETLGRFNEIPNHLMDAWFYWDKNEKPLATITYFPLWHLEQFYKRYSMYDEAIAVNDKILDFIISTGGDNHPELCNALYMRGCIFFDAEKRKEAIAAYERAISVANENGNSDFDILGHIYGNLIGSLAFEKEIQRCKEQLQTLQSYCIATNNSKYYANTVYHCALILEGLYCYDDALAFIELIPSDVLSTDERSQIKDMQNTYSQKIQLLSDFENLVKDQALLSVGTSDWYDVSYDIASAYMTNGNFQQCFKMLETIYQAYKSDPSNLDASPLYLMDGLLLVSERMENNVSFLKYALEKSDYLKTIKDAHQHYVIDNLNEIVVGQLRCQQLQGIDERLEQLEIFYRTQYGEVSNEYAVYLHNRGRAYQLQKKLDEAKEILLKSISTQNKVNGRPMERTVKYYFEVEQELGEL